MRRRDVLAGLSSVLGVLGLTGCNGLADDSEPMVPGAGTRTLTPAPVPTASATPHPAAARSGACPEFSLDAEIVRCASEAAAGSVRLAPESSTYHSGSGSFGFTLRNDTTLTFRTGRDQWLLAQRLGDEWTIIARGEGEDVLWVEPGDSFSWVLGGDATAAAETGTETGDGLVDAGPEPLEAAVGGGAHALVVIGAVPRGARTALVARFRIEPSLG